MAGLEATVTVTTEDWVEASAAVTVWVTGPLKSWATPLAGVTETPVLVIVGTRALTSVPNGTVRAMVCAASSIVPSTGDMSPRKPNAVMAFAELAATTLNLRLLLHPPALPAALLPRTFQVRSTFWGSASVHFHERPVMGLFPKSTSPPLETRNSHVAASCALLHLKVGVVVAMVPTGVLALGVPGVTLLRGPSWPAARAGPARSRATRSISTSVVAGARGERPHSQFPVVPIVPASVSVDRDVHRLSRGQRRRATAAHDDAGGPARGDDEPLPSLAAGLLHRGLEDAVPGLHAIERAETAHDLSEQRVHAVEVWIRDVGDEELRIPAVEQIAARHAHGAASEADGVDLGAQHVLLSLRAARAGQTALDHGERLRAGVAGEQREEGAAATWRASSGGACRPTAPPIVVWMNG